MSSRRAAIRREHMDRQKINKHNSVNGELERLVEKGTLEGRVLAIAITFPILKEKYKFSKKNLERLLDVTGKESAKFSQPATQFVLQQYQDKMVNKISKMPLNVNVFDVKQQIYELRKNEVFITSCAMLFIALNQEFNYSTNSKETGRIDKLIDLLLMEFEKMQCGNKNINYYIKQLEEKTSISL